MSVFVPTAIGLLLLGALSLFAYRFYQRAAAAANLARAQSSFRGRREWLEASFLTLAGNSGKPRGLHWADCDFDNEVAFAREPDTGAVHAFVGVTIRFEAIEGGGMEDVEAVANLRAATAVFCFDGRDWMTEGRSIFNLSPRQAILHFDLRPAPAE